MVGGRIIARQIDFDRPLIAAKDQLRGVLLDIRETW
jgi:hypothetical protein